MNIIDLLKDKEKVKKVLEEVINEKNKKLTEILIPLAQDPQLTYLYALAIIKDKIKDEWEEIILQDHVWTYLYTFNVLGKRWEKGEETIIKDPWVSYKYAKDVVKGRWKEGERVISRDAFSSYMYAKNVVKDRWKDGEEAIVKNDVHRENYKMFLKKINKLEEFLRDFPELKNKEK
jgi:hypothetical protein